MAHQGKVVTLITVIVLNLGVGQGLLCSREGLFGQTTYFSCPDDGDRPEEKFCCGSDENRYCCASIIDEDFIEDVVERQTRSSPHQTPPDIPVVPERREEVEGVRERAREGVKKVREKAKEKAVEKIKEKAKKKAMSKLPMIIGVVAVFIIGLVIACVVCCCCCPFCLLYKRRNRGVVHNPPPDTAVMQPLQNQPGYVAQAYVPQPGYPPTQPTQPPYPAHPAYPPQPGYPMPQSGYPNEQPPSYSEKQLPYNPNY